ncbi:methyl-accepting chemotaxis protein [Citromicrobium bathyomarinum]|uniref:methyl-accepting chemotaxis protein n=1 Tax=Sphingomonadales TaxID=204457 RepID=UPI000C41D1D5|nr:Tar ligand binding domain-containing protein [Citromicrobium sp.]MBO82197.1 chemotaxis protein [Citromicrobium sp.]|tara:strand:+ start:13649 stop:15412 length:1764 start_codon:yes stop_codon:yes gene_type:complete
MTLKLKLFVCLAILSAALLALAGAFYQTARTNEAALSTILVDRVQPLEDLKTVADTYAVLIVDNAHKALNGNVGYGEAADNVRAGAAAIDEAWQSYRATEIEGEEEQLAQQAEAQMAAADAAVERLEAILDSGNAAALQRFVERDLYQTIDPLSETITSLSAMQIDIASSVTEGALKDTGLALTIVVVLAILAVAAIALSIFIVTRKVVRPITNLSSVVHDLAKSGDGQLPHLEQKDEIGDMARAIDAFLNAVLEKERAAAAITAREQKMVTDTLAEGLSALAAGDLTVEVTAAYPPAYAGLKSNYNDAVKSLRTLIEGVARGTETIRGSSSEIAQSSESLARRTEANAASLEETSAALAQMNDRISRGASAAKDTADSANQANSVVRDGRSLAEQAMQAMGRVQESAEGIDTVIEGLDKIAFQTRVLAMNAAVEAGRAGEAGRGFAVVADLVSALAMRAEEEAGSAREQLTTTQEEVGNAVGTVQRVDAALEQISSSVGNVNQLLDTMAADNQAQASAIAEIVTAVSDMDRSTQQNAAMVEETSAASRQLASEVTVLAEEAAHFRTGPAAAHAIPLVHQAQSASLH